MATAITINLPFDLSEVFETVQLAAFGYDPPAHCRPCGGGRQRSFRRSAGCPFDGNVRKSHCPFAEWNRDDANPCSSKTNEEAGPSGKQDGCPLRSPDTNDVVTVSKENGLNITLDVHNFKPEELKVKVVNNSIVVEGNLQDTQCPVRSFRREYAIPEHCDADKIVSTFSPDCILTVSAPAKQEPSPGSEKPESGSGDQ